MSVKEEIIKGLSDSVLNMEEEQTAGYAHRAVKEEIDAFEAIDKGLADGMRRAGDLFESEEYFIPELLVCADAMITGVDILKPHIKADNQIKAKTKVVIGVIEGDTHDIGKNLVKVLLESGNFEVFDLGRDVPPTRFVETAIENNADVIAISTLMTTTMVGMKKVIDQLNEEGIREQYKVIVGGGPISQGYANQIGADGYSPNATEALRLLKGLVAE